MIKRSRIAVLAAAALALTAVSCGSDEKAATTTESTTTSAPAVTEPSTVETDAPASSTTAAETTTTAASTTAAPAEPGTLVLYSGRNEGLVAPLIEQFEKETGIKVEVRYGSSSEMGAQLLEEGDKTPADVFYSQEVGALGMLSIAGLLSSLPDDVVALADERFQPADGNHWVGVTGRSRVIVYNPDLVPEPPTGVLELTDAKWAGKVAI
ncbi:MAG TPA: extracellular solute-binding protein, partial [Ilumatobacteraceae bacterium]|nr:extracellular solute-binding protein [Ilumatobacteraceae bacterium]